MVYLFFIFLVLLPLHVDSVENSNGECTRFTATATSNYLESHSTYGSTLYPRNSNLCWKISVANGLDGYIVSLKNLNFTLEQSNGCENDYLQFRDGFDANSTIIGRCCGVNSWTFVTTSSMYMTIEFKTNDDLNYEGFRLEYQAKPLSGRARVRNGDSYNFNSNTNNINTGGMSTGVLAGIIIGALIGAIAVCVCICVLASMAAK